MPTREVRRGCLDSHRRPAFSAPRLSINRRQAGASVVAALPFFFPGSKEAQAGGVAKPTNEVVKTVNGIRCEFAEGDEREGGREGGRGREREREGCRMSTLAMITLNPTANALHSGVPMLCTQAETSHLKPPKS